MTESDWIKYWDWFLKGSGGKPGYKVALGRRPWFLLHLLFAVFLASVVCGTLEESAKTVLLPLVGILIGLSFAWAGNIQALMQSVEIDELSKRHKGGFADYVYSYQTAIFIILLTLALWAAAGLGVFDKFWPTAMMLYPYFCIKIALFFLSSLTLYECWHVVLGVSSMLLAQKIVKKKIEKDKNRESSE